MASNQQAQNEFDRAVRRYHMDAEFHANADTAVALVAHVLRLSDDERQTAVAAAAVALLVAEEGMFD
jgi:hypothetical protein